MEWLGNVMQKRRRTPQEKKIKSYQHDCRDAYRENNKSRRKAIPLRKALQNRAFRRAAKVQVLTADKTPTAAEILAIRRAKFDWRKGSDAPLMEWFDKPERSYRSDWNHVKKLKSKPKRLVREARKRSLKGDHQRPFEYDSPYNYES